MGGNCCTQDLPKQEVNLNSRLPKHPRFKVCQIPFPLQDAQDINTPFYTQTKKSSSGNESARSKIEMSMWTLNKTVKDSSRDKHALQLFLEDSHCIAISVGQDITNYSSSQEVMSLLKEQVGPILERKARMSIQVGQKGSVPIYMLMESHCPYLGILENYCLDQDYEVIIVPPYGVNGGSGIDIVYNKISKKLVKRGVRPKSMKATFVEMGDEEFAEKLKEERRTQNKVNLFDGKMKSFDEARYQRWDSKLKKSIIY